MKTVLILALFIVLSLASRTSNQAHLAKEHNLGNILKKTSLGNGLISLVNMYARNKQGTDEEWQDLFDALELLTESLNQKIVDENEDFESDGIEHKAEVERITALIVEYQGTEAVLEDEQDRLQTQFDALSLEMKDLEGQLAAGIKGRDNEIKYLADSKAKYEIDFNDYSDAIEMLTQANEKLSEAHESAESAAFSTFLQVNELNFNNFAQLMEKQVNKLSQSKNLYIHPIASVFSALKNQEDVSSDRIQLAINALSDLIIQLSKGQLKLKQNFDADQAAHTELMNGFISEIQQLNTVHIPTTQASIDVNRDANDLNEAALAAVQANIRTEQTNLADENESWEKRKEINVMLLAQLEKELQIVQSAEDILSSKKQQ